MYPENAQTRTRDVRGGMLPPSQRKSDVEKGTIGGIGESLLKGMGWREGKGIGDRNKVRFFFNLYLKISKFGEKFSLNVNLIVRYRT